MSERTPVPRPNHLVVLFVHVCLLFQTLRLAAPGMKSSSRIAIRVTGIALLAYVALVRAVVITGGKNGVWFTPARSVSGTSIYHGLEAKAYEEPCGVQNHQRFGL